MEVSYCPAGVKLGRSPAPPPMIWAPPLVVGAPLHPNRALVPNCILNLMDMVDIVFLDFIA